ncbi:MAG: SOS response-associated peptidase [Synechococcales cyanobacterium M58_A2018_015]|nr:SOS response-associated peptidase [Synechococcales cyanobacterium M58_A2018_015]
MCGRFTLTQSADAIADAFDLLELPIVAPRYNIAPTQPVPVVRAEAGSAQRQFTYLYWGLIPSWAKDPSMGARMINARAETVTEKPAFRAAFKRRRCLIVADGFYEWQATGRQKQPYYFCLPDRQPFALAGLWEHWQSSLGDEIESCTILTTAANDRLRPIHDRMPVILNRSQYNLWLDPQVQSADRLLPLLQPYPAEAMQHYPVSRAVNNPQNDSPDCIQPLDEVGAN